MKLDVKRENEDPEVAQQDATEVAKQIIGGWVGGVRLAAVQLPLPASRCAACQVAAQKLACLRIMSCADLHPTMTPDPSLLHCPSPVEHGGTCTDELAASHYCVLQHRKQPE